jgi:hypothetical protein
VRKKVFSCVILTACMTMAYMAALTTHAGAGTAKTVCAKFLERTENRYGDTLTSYTLGKGKIEVPAPSPSFDPATAPADRIKSLGFPEKPLPKTRGYAEWVKSLTKVNQERPQAPCVRLGVRAAPDQTLLNWSGYTAIAPLSPAPEFTAATTDYTLPAYNAATCLHDTFTTWAGLGGLAAGDPLVQTGLYVDNYSESAIAATPFWEIVGGTDDTGGVVGLTGPPLVGGHAYTFTVRVNEGGNGRIRFSVADPATVQTSTLLYQPIGGTSQYNSRNADFISERLLMSDGHFSAYMNNGTTKFGGSFANSSTNPSASWDALLDLDRSNITMAGRNGTTLGTAGMVNQTDFFSATWRACGVPE